MSDAEKTLRALLDAALTHELLENADNAFLDSGGTGYRNAEGYDAARRVLVDGLVSTILPSFQAIAIPDLHPQAPAEAVTVEQGWALRRKDDASLFVGELGGWAKAKDALLAPTPDHFTLLTPNPDDWQSVYLKRRVTVREGSGA